MVWELDSRSMYYDPARQNHVSPLLPPKLFATNFKGTYGQTKGDFLELILSVVQFRSVVNMAGREIERRERRK
jgi:hypothetical protein